MESESSTVTTEYQMTEAEISKSTSMMDKGESFRRHDGTLSIKRPNWEKINSIEEERREILKRESYNILV